MYTVYVVDDDPFIVSDIVETVPWLDNGFTVIGSSTSPSVALREIPELAPHVVFSDLRMPFISGIEMMKELNRQGYQGKYIMLSAYGTFEDLRRFFLNGGFDYILKPIDLSELQLILERLAKKLSDSLPEEGSIDGELLEVNQSFVEMLRYLDDNYTQKQTLYKLAKQFNLSPNYICRLFSKKLDTTLTQYITNLRMKAALEMMKTSKAAYKEVAIACGYSDYLYFCRVFRDYYGAPPTTYMQAVGNALGK